MFFYTITAVPIAFDILFPNCFKLKGFSFAEIVIPFMTILDIMYISAILEFQQRKNRALKNELSQFYFCYRRFAPKNALPLFKDKGIGDLKVGLSTEGRMTLMSIGIEVISPDNTKINLREQFETLSFYFATIIEKIHKHNGTVLTIYNYGISSLF